MAPGAKVAEALAAIEQHQGEKTPLFEKTLVQIKELSSSTTADDLIAVVQAFFNQSLGIVSTLQILNFFIKTLQELEDKELWIDVGNRTLAILAAQPSAFPEIVGRILELVADAFEANEDWVEAAKALSEIPLDSSQRQITVEQRAGIWIRVVRNYLEVDDSTSAETYINKLKNIMHQVSDPELTLHFNLSQARIWDAKREFLHAANKYHELSFSSAIAEEERMHTLGMAAKCAILAPAGPMRSRTLGRLHKDERSVQLPEFGILEKIFFDRILSQDEVDTFAKGLQHHQLAIVSDGSTVLAKAVVEHNLLAVSRLYSNITFEALGRRLGLDGDKAEETTARMIEQGRLVGRMDQLDGIIYFERGEASGQKGSGRAGVSVGKEIRRWDANVESLAEEVENITTVLHQKFPEFVEKNLVS